MVKNIKLALFGSAALSLGACDIFNEEYAKEWNKEFATACVKESVALGDSSEFSEQLCACVSADLLARLDGVVEKASPPEEKVNASFDKCAAEISAAE